MSTASPPSRSGRAALLDAARRVVQREAAAVAALEQQLDEGFVVACELVLSCRGRVVCAGVGKSGIVARKLAASFASLGTPALFVHAAEALHGDLGMITGSDVVVLFSHSGTTPEVLAMLPSLARMAVPVIAVTDDRASPLAAAAAVTVDPGCREEADHLGLAPTASTTAALVLADALAVAVAQVSGFTAEDFARTHPGGALGTALAEEVP